MVTKDIKKLNPNWSIWTDGCPPSDQHKGESVQEMTDRVDGVIKKVRDLHRKVGWAWGLKCPCVGWYVGLITVRACGRSYYHSFVGGIMPPHAICQVSPLWVGRSMLIVR